LPFFREHSRAIAASIDDMSAPTLRAEPFASIVGPIQSMKVVARHSRSVWITNFRATHWKADW
jgi:hypothetical protein